jgi:c-di-GMP-binding flagellar brake protein YcgR
MLNFFSSNKKQQNSHLSNPKFIIKPSEVYQLIKYICDEQIPLIISGENSQQEETSYLLKVGSELFIFDRLSDQNSHRALLNSETVKVRAKVDGVNVTFNTSLESHLPQANEDYYKAALPSKIYNPQRRNRCRILIPDDYKIPFVTKHRVEDMLLTGRLLDLTCDGIAIMLDNRIFARKGERVRSCTISPPGSHVISFDMEIRSSKPSEISEQMMRIGARIIDPNWKARKQLGGLVIALERMHHKRKNEEKS